MTSNKFNTNKLLTTKDLSIIYGVQKRTIQKWAREGIIKGIKVGKMWRFHKEDLENISGFCKG